MNRYLIKRLVDSVLTLAVAMTAIFFLIRVAPGGPFDSEVTLPAAIKMNIEAKYGLNEALPVQFFRWLRDAAQGDLRESFHYVGTPVSQLISESFPISILLGFLAFLLATILGLGLGAIAAWKKDTYWDVGAMILAVTGINLPTYLFASLLVLVFSQTLGWLSPALLEQPSDYILPIITLASRPAALIARLTRASMLEALQGDYIRTAFAKGTTELRVIFVHALRNSLIPAITLMGPLLANLITGSFVVELIFQIPGLGQHYVTGVLNRDYPMVMGASLVYGVFLIAANFLVDLAYAWADPRVRLA